MARPTKPKHGSLKRIGKRYYWNVKLPGEEKYGSKALRVGDKGASVTDRQLAIELANEKWNKAIEALEKRQTPQDGYDGTIESLRDLYLDARKNELSIKEWRFQRAAINDLIKFLSANFTLVTKELKTNRLILWREWLCNDKRICRDTINKKVNVIKQMIDFIVNWEKESAELLQVKSLKPIKKGDEKFFDYPEVEPADWNDVKKLFPYVSSMIQDMLTIIRFTGARPGEVRVMRPGDIDRSDHNIWIYTLAEHKTERFGYTRTIAIGKQAQEVLIKYLFRGANEYCFQPVNKNNKEAGLHYSSGSFAKLIARTVRNYNADHPSDQIAFHAHQLRHTFGTEVCLKCGLEATQHVLGHASPEMTKRYARQALAQQRMESVTRTVKKMG